MRKLLIVITGLVIASISTIPVYADKVKIVEIEKKHEKLFTDSYTTCMKEQVERVTLGLPRVSIESCLYTKAYISNKEDKITDKKSYLVELTGLDKRRPPYFVVMLVDNSITIAFYYHNPYSESSKEVKFKFRSGKGQVIDGVLSQENTRNGVNFIMDSEASLEVLKELSKTNADNFTIRVENGAPFEATFEAKNLSMSATDLLLLKEQIN